MFWEYVLQNLSYIAVVAINIWVIIKVFKDVTSGEDDQNDDNDGGGGISWDDPELDLPPGVTLPREPSELVPS